MSSSIWCFLTCIQISQEEGQVVWYPHLSQNFPQFIVIHRVKGFGIVNKAEVDVFLKFCCFFYDPTDVDSSISGSSAFSKISLNIWKFTVHILLRPGLENFEHFYQWQEYTEKLYKKDLHDQDNHDGIITKPKGQISWNVKSSGPWKASLRTKLVEVMEFQLSYSKSWKMMQWKCCTQYVSKFGKLSSGHRTGKGQFSFQSQRKAMPRNAQTTTQLHSSHRLGK